MGAIAKKLTGDEKEYVLDGEEWLRSTMYNLTCMRCKHYHPYTDPETVNTCNAYPDGIPLEILEDKVDHHKPYKGDHGIQFEPRDV